ncbi:MAG: hypothetical protein IJD28_00235 [Deferribacterales bacterium]|nr:hypothetical protein [Deferribacterales bacterium]
MEKVDILIALLGVASYVAIMMDLRSYERRLKQFEEIQEKKRLYTQRLLEKKKAERARELAAEKRAARQNEVAQLSGVVEKLGAMEDAEVMRKSRVTGGKLGL